MRPTKAPNWPRPGAMFLALEDDAEDVQTLGDEDDASLAEFLAWVRSLDEDDKHDLMAVGLPS